MSSTELCVGAVVLCMNSLMFVYAFLMRVVQITARRSKEINLTAVGGHISS